MTTPSNAPPLAELGQPWPTAAPHAQTGWRQPIDRVSTSTGQVVRIDTAGDAVPGGYNGTFWALSDERARLGRLDYQSAPGDVLIAWIEVQPAFRRHGLASLLVARLAHEFPGARISAGVTTPEGGAWWRSVERSLKSQETR